MGNLEEKVTSGPEETFLVVGPRDKKKLLKGHDYIRILTKSSRPSFTKKDKQNLFYPDKRNGYNEGRVVNVSGIGLRLKEASYTRDKIFLTYVINKSSEDTVVEGTRKGLEPKYGNVIGYKETSKEDYQEKNNVQAVEEEKIEKIKQEYKKVNSGEKQKKKKQKEKNKIKDDKNTALEVEELVLIYPLSDYERERTGFQMREPKHIVIIPEIELSKDEKRSLIPKQNDPFNYTPYAEITLRGKTLPLTSDQGVSSRRYITYGTKIIEIKD